MEPKSATRVDEVDLLRYQNIALQKQLVSLQEDGFKNLLVSKYGPDVLGMQSDGTLVRKPTEATP